MDTLSGAVGVKNTNKWTEVGACFKRGEHVTDEKFDQIYPLSIRKLSSDHWTPVDVAIAATKLLVTRDGDKILDVGSGCGKFCTIGALSSPARFYGIEQRAHLLIVAREAVSRLKISNAKFMFGNMATLDWSLYNGFYFFNPFYENRFKLAKIDETISVSYEKFQLYTETVVSKLSAVKAGTRVLTYHGFGGVMPDCFELVKVQEIGSHHLDLWIKRQG